jgi:hypothetical protein
MNMQAIDYKGWKSIRLANRQVELVVTRDVGPRIIRFGFIGGPNLFAEFAGQQGGRGESEWMIRGGHRLWIAPEAKPWSYELDNEPYELAEAIPNGVRAVQAPGPLTGIAKQMEITLDPDRNQVAVVHTLTNRRATPARCSVWTPSVMGPGGQAILPLPAKVPHTDCLAPTQNWSLWSYTVLNDPRFTFGRDYIFFRHDASRGPNKIGLMQREGWAAYQREEMLFVKYFDCVADAAYPDGNVNCECFSNEEMLEVESLGPLVSLQQNESVNRTEVWKLFSPVARCASEEDADRWVKPLI